MRKIKIVDTTLRDGSHAMGHSFSIDQVEKIVEGLDKAGCEIIELSHGDGIAGSSCNYGFIKTDEMTLLKAAAAKIHNAKLTVLLIPGIGTIDDLLIAQEIGAKVVRVATHVTEADIAIQHIKYAKQTGMMAVGFLMMAHMSAPLDIVEQAKVMVDAGADYINLADSAGYMMPDDVRARISALKASIDVPIGFHAHNNLSMAVANSLVAIDEGADYIDATCRGLGAGAGNAQHEVLLAILNRQGCETGEDLYSVMDLAQEIVEPIMHRPQTINSASMMLGYAGVYSSFLLHTYRAAEKYGLNPRNILVELGKRKMVGGQEDMILDVAYQMTK